MTQEKEYLRVDHTNQVSPQLGGQVRAGGGTG